MGSNTSNPKESKSYVDCGRCGQSHDKRKCPAGNLLCSKCAHIGHLPHMCRTRVQYEVPLNTTASQGKDTDDQEQKIRRIVLETLSEKSNSSVHNDILERMLGVVECSITRGEKQEGHMSPSDLEVLNILVRKMSTNDNYSNKQIGEEDRTVQLNLILEKMMQLKGMPTGNNSGSSQFDNDKYSSQGEGHGNFQTRPDNKNQDSEQSSGQGKLQPGQEPFRAYSPLQRAPQFQDHYQSQGDQARSGSPSRRDEHNNIIYREQARACSPSRRGAHNNPNYRGGQARTRGRGFSRGVAYNTPNYRGGQARTSRPSRRGEYNNPNDTEEETLGSSPSRRGAHNNPNDTGEHARASSSSRMGAHNNPEGQARTSSPSRRGAYNNPNDTEEQAQANSPSRSGGHNNPNHRGGQARARGSSRGGAYNLQSPNHRDKARGGPLNAQNNLQSMVFHNQHSKHFPSKGFYNVVAGPPPPVEPQDPENNYRQYEDPREYDNSHQMRGAMNDRQDHDHNNPSVNYQNGPPLLNNYQNVPPPPHHFLNVPPPPHHYQNHPAQEPHGQSYVETRQQANYGGNRGNYRGRGFVGQNRPFNRGARHYAKQMHSQGGSMHNNQQQPPNKNDRNAIGAKKKNDGRTFQNKKTNPTQEGSISSEHESASEKHDQSSEDEAAKAETMKTDENLKVIKKKKKKKKAATKEVPTNEEEKNGDSSEVALAGEKSPEEAEDDLEASQTERISGTTPKEGENNSGVTNAHGKSKCLQLFIASGHLMDLPEGVSLNQEIDDVVLMAKDGEGIFAFQPKTICEFMELKKKYPNSQAIIVP